MANATSVYRAVFGNAGHQLGGGKREARAANFLENRLTFVKQRERDVAFWYGTLKKQKKAWKKTMLNRIMTTLFYSGLMVKRGNSWWTWHKQGMPIACALSHGGRVLIQLPKNSNDTYWNWLWAGHHVQPRAAATHGVLPMGRRHELPFGRFKSIVETKKHGEGQHYGVNIAGGGYHNTNPFSGNLITDDGEHGHVYICYKRPTPVAYGAVLVGVEDSAPMDRNNYHFAMGQAGHKHTFGTPGTYSFTGGEKWGAMGRLTGPQGSIDTLFIDLASGPFHDRLTQNYYKNRFNRVRIDEPGKRPQALTGGAGVMAVNCPIPTPIEWKVLAGVHKLGKEKPSAAEKNLKRQIDEEVAEYDRAFTMMDHLNARQRLLKLCRDWQEDRALKGRPGTLAVRMLEARAMRAPSI